MRKLTKDQRYYRAKKKEAERNFRRIKDREGKLAIKVTRKPLNVSIKQEAFNKLQDLAKRAELSNWEMLTRILNHQIPQYQSLNDSLQRYDWPKIKPAETKHYKGSTGNKQITYRITTTAWNKLDCHSKAIGKSKARIVQELIMDHKQIPQKTLETKKKKLVIENHQRAWNRASLRSGKLYINSNNEIKHSKGIPMEMWDKKEWECHDALAKVREERLESQKIYLTQNQQQQQ